jgi:diaminopimelate decarboxylase
MTDARFRLSDDQVRRLAKRFGTPLYVLDEATIRSRIREYFEAFSSCWPKVRLSYASKANGTMAVLAIAHKEGCWIDCASEGELRAALGAEVPAERCCLHGNNKSAGELLFALDAGVGEVIADNFEELAMLATNFELRTSSTRVLLRLAPGVAPQTHAKISTGQADTKFGFSIADGSAERALRYCLDRGIPVHGFHCHVGSQLLDPEAQVAGGLALASFAAEMKQKLGFAADLLNMGGGLGARYTNEQRMAVGEYCRMLVEAIAPTLAEADLNPELAQEPGRAIVAEAGVTLYAVGVVKEAGRTRFVVVDGGMADNPRPALYGAKYEVLHIPGSALTPQPPLPKVEGECRTVVSGRHCESDTLFEDVDLPQAIEPGDILQVLTTGAYATSMASNYNRYPRPATVLIREDGRIEMVQRPDTYEEMMAREMLPEDLCG